MLSYGRYGRRVVVDMLLLKTKKEVLIMFYRCITCKDILSALKLTELSSGEIFCYRCWLYRLDCVCRWIEMITKNTRRC